MKERLSDTVNKGDEQIVCIPLNPHSLKIKKKRSASEQPPLLPNRLSKCLQITQYGNAKKYRQQQMDSIQSLFSRLFQISRCEPLLSLYWKSQFEYREISMDQVVDMDGTLNTVAAKDDSDLFKISGANQNIGSPENLKRTPSNHDSMSVSTNYTGQNALLLELKEEFESRNKTEDPIIVFLNNNPYHQQVPHPLFGIDNQSVIHSHQ